MNGSTGVQRIASAILTLAVPIVLFFSPLYLFVTNGFVAHEYNSRDFPISERFDRIERERLSSVIIGYLRGRASEEDMATMVTDDGEVAMRSKEVEHIADVKAVMDGMFVVHGIALVCGLAAVLVLRPRKRQLAMSLRRGLGVAGGIVGLVLLSSLIDFDSFFTQFHQIFFQPDTWLFYVTDTLIQLYPLPLWVAAVWKMGVVILIELVFTLGVSAFVIRGADEAKRGD